MPDPTSIGAVQWTFGGLLAVVLIAAIVILRDYLKGQAELRKAETEWTRTLITELRMERHTDTAAYKELVDQMREGQRADTKVYVDLTRRMIEGQQVTATALDAVCAGQDQLSEQQSHILRAVGAKQ